MRGGLILIGEKTGAFQYNINVMLFPGNFSRTFLRIYFYFLAIDEQGVKLLAAPYAARSINDILADLTFAAPAQPGSMTGLNAQMSTLPL